MKKSLKAAEKDSKSTEESLYPKHIGHYGLNYAFDWKGFKSAILKCLDQRKENKS